MTKTIAAASGDSPLGPNVELFSSQFAPVRVDPVYGTRETWTRERFIAAGYLVVDVAPDLFAVDLDSQKQALPPGADKPAFDD